MIPNRYTGIMPMSSTVLNIGLDYLLLITIEMGKMAFILFKPTRSTGRTVSSIVYALERKIHFVYN